MQGDGCAPRTGPAIRTGGAGVISAKMQDQFERRSLTESHAALLEATLRAFD